MNRTRLLPENKQSRVVHLTYIYDERPLRYFDRYSSRICTSNTKKDPGSIVNRKSTNDISKRREKQEGGEEKETLSLSPQRFKATVHSTRCRNALKHSFCSFSFNEGRRRRTTASQRLWRLWIKWTVAQSRTSLYTKHPCPDSDSSRHTQHGRL